MDLKSLPKLKFVETDEEPLLSAAKKLCEEILGRTLGRADPLMLVLKSLIAIILQQRVLLNKVAADNLLAYANDAPLDHLGALVGVQRLPAAAAVVTCKLKLSAPMTHTVTIKQGTRVTAGDEVTFAMDAPLIFFPGEVEKTAKFTCTETGAKGNVYGIGELKIIVDPQAFLAEIENITVPEGGADVESNDNLRERIRIAPESFSVAGPNGAYEFFVKQASSLITDVLVDSENPGEVDIYFLLEGGELPGTEMLELVAEHLNNREVRPLTDHVFVKLPEVKNFDIELRYYIAITDKARVTDIQQAVENAIDDYIIWQKSRLGRDLNKTELEYRIRAAGAKRVEIISPQFEVLPSNTVAVCENKFVTFGGVEAE